MTAPTRPYLFYDTAVSLCGTCYRRIDAKIVFENDSVYMLKRCPQHGFQRVLIADNVDYYRRCCSAQVEMSHLCQVEVSERHGLGSDEFEGSSAH